jgi:hypothetical protein
MKIESVTRNRAPIGYIDVRLARDLVRRRMFLDEVPAPLLGAAMANFAKATNPTSGILLKRAEIPSYPEPMELIAGAIESGALTLFMHAESGNRCVPVPRSSGTEALERAGLLRVSRQTIAFRFMHFYPRRLFDGLDLPGMPREQFDKFALCLREVVFDEWLTKTARQQRWPLDAKPRRGRGRPDRVSVVKPLLKEIIHRGLWRQGMPLKELFHLINSKLKGEEVDRETIKKGLVELYSESGQIEYKYVPRTRSPSKRRS